MLAITRQAFTQALATNGGYVIIDELPENVRKALHRSGVTDSDLEEVAGRDRVIRSSEEWSSLYSRIDGVGPGGEGSISAHDAAGRPTASARAFEALERCVSENRARAEREGGRRFQGEPVLAQVAQGGRTLGPGDQGEGVLRIEQALSDLGLLDRVRSPSSTYGATTTQAVERFQREVGLTVTGRVDADTLGALAAVAPPPGQELVRSAEYDRLYAEGRLGVTIALTESSGQAAAEEVRDVLRGLRAQGYSPVREPGDLERLGVSGEVLDPNARYFARTFHDEKLDRDVDVVVRLLLPTSDASSDRASLDRAVRQDHVVLVAGGKSAPSAMFSAGEGSAEGAGRGAVPRAGLRRTFGNERADAGSRAARPDYQLLVLDAPGADLRLEGARGGKRDAVDRGVIGGARPAAFSERGQVLARFLEGVTRRESNNSMLEGVGAREHAALALFGLDQVAPAGARHVESGFIASASRARRAP